MRFRNSKTRRGYTLIEMLIAMIMFAFITAATALALSTAIQGQHASQKKASEAQEARAILNILSRDLRSAYVSAANPNTFFIATGDSSASLTFTSLTHRISTATDSSGNEDTSNVIPQSDVSIITYGYDPNSGILTRTESATPSTDYQPSSDTPDAILSRRVRNIQFSFLDPANPSTSSMRDSWSYQTLSTSTTGQGQTSQNQQQTTSSDQQDTMLPMSVQISLALDDGEGHVRDYTTNVSIASSFIPQPKGQAPDPPATTSGTNGTGGTGGTGGKGGTGGTGGTKAYYLPGLGGIGPR